LEREGAGERGSWRERELGERELEREGAGSWSSMSVICWSKEEHGLLEQGEQRAGVGKYWELERGGLGAGEAGR